MANSCLGLNEIVTSIAAILVSDKATASAVAFARCSRSLEEPVLCEVWRCLSSLEPLIKCFPPEVWEYKNGELASSNDSDVILWSNRFQIAFQESPVKYRMDSISTEIRIKGPTPAGVWILLSYWRYLLSCSPTASNLLSWWSPPSQSLVLGLEHWRCRSSFHNNVFYLSLIGVDQHRDICLRKSYFTLNIDEAFHIGARHQRCCSPTTEVWAFIGRGILPTVNAVQPQPTPYI